MSTTPTKRDALRRVSLHERTSDPHGDRQYTDDELAAHVAVDGVGGPAVHPQYLLARNSTTYFMWKGVVIEFSGTLAINHSFNVASLASQGAGVYRVEIDQNTINGVDISSLLVPSLAVYAPDSLEVVSIQLQPGAPAGFVDVYTYIMDVQGNSVFDVPYTLGANDIAWLQGLINVIDPNADPLPP